MSDLRRSEEEAARILEHFEDRHKVFSYAVRGVSVWRILRFPISLAIQNIKLTTPAIPRRDLLCSVFGGLRKIFRLRRTCNYVAITYASALRVQSSKGYDDIYFDALLNNLPGGVKISSLNAPGYANRISKASIAPVFDSTIILVVSVILARLFPVKDDAGIFAKIAECVLAELRLDEFSETRIRRNFSAFWWRCVLYDLLLRRLSPEIVLAADAGQYPVIHACRRQGIRFVELQHGIFSPNHPDALPATALSTDAEHLLLPDFVAMYGEYWVRRLKHTAVARTGTLVAVGSSIIEQYRTMRQNLFCIDEKNLVLTLTTQGIEHGTLIHFMHSFLSNTSASLQLNIKLHPAYDTSYDDYVAAFQKDVRVRILRGREDPNTYELIALSDVHLSISSACHFDAIGIGTPTVIIALGGFDLVRDLVRDGDAIVVSTPEQLVDVVLHRHWLPITQETSNKYYQQNFVGNLKELLQL